MQYSCSATPVAGRSTIYIYIYIYVLIYIYFARANALLFLFLIYFIYLSAYSVIGLRLASRDTHYFLARDGRGVRKIDRKCFSFWIPA